MILDLGRTISSKMQALFGKQVGDKEIEQAMKEICISLLHANVNPKYVAKLREDVKNKIDSTKLETNANRARAVQHAIFESLVEMMSPSTLPYKIERGKTNVVVFVGLQGSGKTTSICKYANYHKRKGFKTGIVCADTFRAGAFDQVKQNATRIGVPFYGSSNPDPVQVAREGVAKFRKSDFELILVDTSGRHTQEDALFSEMRELVAAVKPNNIVFVMDSGIGQSAEEQAVGFKDSVAIGGVILTKLDGAEKAGGSLSSVAATGCPIEFVGTGEHMDDIEPFNAKSFVSKMLGMGDIEGLAEKIARLDIDQEEVVSKLSTGNFRLVDFKNIYSQLISMGPLTKMLQMVPGMQDFSIPDESKFNKILYVFDSLSKGELNSKGGDLFTRGSSRLRRVAHGSGTSEEFVMEVMANFKQLNNVMKKMMNNPMFSQLFSGNGNIQDCFSMMNQFRQ